MEARTPQNSAATIAHPSGRRQHDVGGEVVLEESHSALVRRMLENARRAAAGDATILLVGESGTGKDVLARQIHRWSPRGNGPFVLVNCTGLPGQLLENELFGHIRGSFSGAFSDQAGKLETARGGTLFFDEVAELTPVFQAKIMRFVQDLSFERIGSNATVTVDVRIIAATNHDLEAEVAAGRFREDLYHRLNVIALTLVPLRERTEDIQTLAEMLLKEACLKANRSALSLSPEAADALKNYRWPGNVRELRNALDYAAALAPNETIVPADLPRTVWQGIAASPRGIGLREREREYILRVLAESATLDQAAATLGINVTTLWRKRKRYGIDSRTS